MVPDHLAYMEVVMLWLKACSRCKTGDVELVKDHYGWFLACVQCGYVRDVERASHVALGRVRPPAVSSTRAA